jgi:4-hydroxybenzoate polyprenyltransferase
MAGAAIPIKEAFYPTQFALALLSYLFVWFFAYTLNDYSDYEDDKKHKRKSKRPIASGKIKPKTARKLMYSFFVISLAIASIVSLAYMVVIASTAFVVLIYNHKHLACRNRMFYAVPLLWLMEFSRVVAGAFYNGYATNDWLILVALPTFYLFTYHFYWEDGKRFEDVKKSKLIFLFLSVALLSYWFINLTLNENRVIIFAAWFAITGAGMLLTRGANFDRQLKYSYYFIYVSLLALMAILWL